MERFLKNYFTQDDEKLKWQTGEENVKTVAVFIFLDSKIAVDGDYPQN